MDVRTSATQRAAESPVSALSSLDTAAVHQTPVPASSTTDTAAAHQPVEAASEGLHAPSHNTVSQTANKRCRIQNPPRNIDNEDPTPWVMVHPRRSRSLDVSTGRHSSMSNEHHPYDPTIEAARERLTPEQRARLNKREVSYPYPTPTLLTSSDPSPLYSASSDPSPPYSASSNVLLTFLCFRTKAPFITKESFHRIVNPFII